MTSRHQFLLHPIPIRVTAATIVQVSPPKPAILHGRRTSSSYLRFACERWSSIASALCRRFHTALSRDRCRSLHTSLWPRNSSTPTISERLRLPECTCPKLGRPSNLSERRQRFPAS